MLGGRSVHGVSAGRKNIRCPLASLRDEDGEGIESGKKYRLCIFPIPECDMRHLETQQSLRLS